MSINWCKLYAVTMALALWGPQLRGKHLLFHCDNISLVHIMAKASTRSKTMMALVCTFMLLTMQHNVQVHIQHIAGVCNDVADILSCFKIDRFQQLCLDAEPEPLTLATHSLLLMLLCRDSSTSGTSVLHTQHILGQV